MTTGGTSRRAPYAQIASELRELITSGELPVGATLPSLTEISKAHTVSPSTAQKAVGVLRDEGLVATGNGIPTVVIADTPTAADTSMEALYWELSGRVDALTADLAALRTLITDLQRPDAATRPRPQRSRSTRD